MSKEAIHVVLPDGSAVQRVSARPYRFAICRKGAERAKAHRALAADLGAAKENKARYQDKLRVLNEGRVIGAKTDRLYQGAREFEVFTIGGVDDLPGMTVNVIVHDDETFDDRLLDAQDRTRKWVDFQSKQVEQLTAALAFIAGKPEEYRVTTDDAAVLPALDYLRPGVFGFSQSLSSAESRARTESRRSNNFRVSDTYVQYVAQGKAPKGALKGRAL